MTSILSSAAMLCDFSVSQWTARKIDKAKSLDLTEAHKAKDKSAHISKKLIDAPTLKEIAKLVTQARELHKELTSPWFENGARILSAPMFHRHKDGLEAIQEKFGPLADQFEREYPSLIYEASREHDALGLLWNESDYPKVTRIRSKFAWRVSYFNLPDEADFRVDIGQDAIDQVKSQITSTVNSMAANAIRDVMERAHEVVASMVESLTKFDPEKSGKARGTFRDTLVTNIRDLADIMPGLNFMGDARIDQLATTLRELTMVDAEQLRASDNIRTGTLAKAIEIQQAVSNFMA